MNDGEALNRLTKNKKVVLFGTGAASRKASSQFTTFSYYVDNDAGKQGTKLNGKDIRSPRDLLHEDKESIMIAVASSYYHEISVQLSSYGFVEGIHYFNGIHPVQAYYANAYRNGKEIDGLHFRDFKTNSFGSHSVGFSEKYIVKIENYSIQEKLNTITQEMEIIQQLNRMQCVSAPKIVKQGYLESGEPYFIQERIYPKGRPSTADLLFSLIEQKNLGFFHGDLKPQNILFDGQVCYLIDYDQTVSSEAFKQLGNRSFIEYIFTYSIERHGVDIQEKYPNMFDKEEMLFLLEGDSFRMGKTTLFLKQNTTLEEDGVYHDLQDPKIHIHGVRDFSERLPLLDQIQFEHHERVLDVGCNLGLLSHYLHDRNCLVTGIDLDPSIVIIARMVSNILNKNIRFENTDMDAIVFEQSYDTICFFSVLQHVQNLRAVGQVAARQSKRIIVENRLWELGEKPVDGKWNQTTSWYFEDVSQMADYFCQVFTGFEMYQCYGKGDRGRYILEFRKSGVRLP